MGGGAFMLLGMLMFCGFWVIVLSLFVVLGVMEPAAIWEFLK